jgi:ribosome-binding protein aMBF1 (putative translation factor)
MPRDSPEDLDRAKKTADKYITRSGGAPPASAPYEPSCRDRRGVELSTQKRKIRNQREEIHKLKEVIRDYKTIIADAKSKGFSHTTRV